jgi:hypothetical protein
MVPTYLKLKVLRFQIIYSPPNLGAVPPPLTIPGFQESIILYIFISHQEILEDLVPSSLSAFSH